MESKPISAFDNLGSVTLRPDTQGKVQLKVTDAPVGTYTFKLTVIDDLQNKGEAKVTVIVYDKPSPTLTATPNPVLNKQEFTLDGQGNPGLNRRIESYSITREPERT